MAKTSYAHLLSSVQAAAAKEVDGGFNAEPVKGEKEPENDEMDNKKSKKAKAKAKAAKDESEDREERDDEEGDEDESEEDKEESEEDKEESEEEKEEDKEDKKKSKKAKASASVSSAELQAARLEERLRCAQIFQSSAAAGKPDLAARFAFHTDLSAETATMLMEGFSAEASAKPRRVSIDERMAAAPSANVGSDVMSGAPAAEPVSEAALAKMSSSQRALAIINAGRALNGEAPLSKLN
jgi:hypothetical protein